MNTTILAAIDPGKRKCGVSVWFVESPTKYELLRAGTVTAANPVKLARLVVSEWLGSATRVISERPQDYRGKTAMAADLESLREFIRAVEALRKIDKLYYPVEWKGGTPKPIHHARLKRALEDVQDAWADRMRDMGPDALDAVGIGLKDITGRIL